MAVISRMSLIVVSDVSHQQQQLPMTCSAISPALPPGTSFPGSFLRFSAAWSPPHEGSLLDDRDHHDASSLLSRLRRRLLAVRTARSSRGR